MRWHDLLAGLDGPARPGRSSSPGIRTSRSTPSPTTAGGSVPARASRASRARPPTATTTRPRRSHAARWRCSSSGPLPLDVPRREVAERACRARPGGRRPLRAPVDGDAGARRHRHQRQDHHHLPARGDRRAGPVTASGVIGTVGAPASRGSRSRPAHTTPEADRPPGAARAACATRARRTVAMEVSSHALDQHRVDGVQFAAVCFTNLTHEHLDYHGSLDAYFEAKAPLVHARASPAAAVNVDDARGDELAARATRRRARRRGPTRSTTTAPTCARSTSSSARRRHALHARRPPERRPTSIVDLPLVGASTSPTRSRPPPPPVPRAFDLDGGGRRARRPGGRARAGSSGSTPGSRSRCWSTTPTPPTPSAACSPPPARSPAPAAGCSCVFGCGGDRDPAKRPLMGAAVAAGADVAVLTSDNPRSEDPQAIADAVLPGPRRRRPQVRVELDRRAAIARRARRRARPATSSSSRARATRPGQTAARAHGAVRRPGRRARGAGGARMELTAAEIATHHGRHASIAGDARRARDLVHHRLARRSSRARASSRSSPSATATTSSPTRSPAARAVALVTDARARGARWHGRRARAPTRSTRWPTSVAPRAPRWATSSSSASPARRARPAPRTSPPPRWRPSSRVHASPGSYNNEAGVPLTLLAPRPTHRGARARDGRARPRQHRRAVRDRPPDRRRDHQHRPGPRRAPRRSRRRRPGEGRAARGARRRRASPCSTPATPRHAGARGPHRRPRSCCVVGR